MFDHVLIASFGTGMAPARASIDAVERALARQAGLPHTCAFTSEAVRGILARRGESVLSAAQALEKAARAGVRRIFVQPTHMLYGGEYEKLRAEVNAVRPRFEKLCLGVPLLAGSAEVRRLAKVLAETYPRRKGERLVLVGHGAAHFADIVYPAMQTAFRMEGRGDVYVGTLKGWPGPAQKRNGLHQNKIFFGGLLCYNEKKQDRGRFRQPRPQAKETAYEQGARTLAPVLL